MKDGGNTPLEVLINFDTKEHQEDVLSWSALVEEGKNQVAQGDRQFLDAEIIADDMSVLLFTSGTTGMAKAVMLSHRNLAEDLMAAPTILNVNTWDIFFSVLPVHHTYECTCAFLMPLYKGAAIAYCQGLKYITKNLEEVQPTMILGVPVLIETLYKKIWKNVRAQGKEKASDQASGYEQKDQEDRPGHQQTVHERDFGSVRRQNESHHLWRRSH